MVKLDIEIKDLDFWATVPTAVVTAYLERNGWQDWNAAVRSGNMPIIYGKGGATQYDTNFVYLPAAPDLYDYGQIMRRAVEAIATAEKSPLLPLLDRMDIDWVNYAGVMANVGRLGVLML